MSRRARSRVAVPLPDGPHGERVAGQAPGRASVHAMARAVPGAARRPASGPGPSNAALSRGLVAGPVPQARLDVSRVGDPFEREADAMAARVVARAPAASPGPIEAGPGGAPFGGASPAARRPVDRAVGGDAPTPDGSTQPEVTPDLEAYITSVSGGDPLPGGVRQRIEPHLGADLTDVRVHATPAAASAAARLQARAFTFGKDIFLGAGESAGDLELMAHEATHVVQQGAVAVYRDEATAGAATDEEESWYDVDVRGWIADNLSGAASGIPGYTMLTQVVGKDPITGAQVATGQTDLLEALLTFGPFGQEVAPLFTAIDVVGDVFAYVSDQLAANGLTYERLVRDIEGAWAEFSITEGIQGNLDILDRYLGGLRNDVRAFVAAIVDHVIEIVRGVVADVVGPLLETPEVGPVWSLAKKVFHYDPLRGEVVDAPTVEILREFLVLIGQEGAAEQMAERGTLQSTADWLDTQWETFTAILADAGHLFTDAWDAITPANLPGLLDTFPDLVNRGVALFRRVLDFGVTLVAKVLELVKGSLMGWLSEYAHQIPGFHLLTVILEKNPFTDEPVPRTAENLIRGFITLLPGGDQMYEQLAESGVIGNAASRIESEMTRLGISWDLITSTFLGVWDLVTLENLLQPVETFGLILDRFGDAIGRIVEFVSVVMEVVITLILALMNFPTDLLGSIVDKAIAAIDTIMADPVQFLVNMLEAVKSGFMNFLGNIATHMVTGLADWLFGGLRELGISLPASFEPGAIFEFVLAVVGVTEETLWTKLGEQIGPERVAQIRAAIDTLSGAWQFVRDVQERGIVAVWDFISGQLSNLWDIILQKAQDWIMDTIIGSVVARLISMLDPTGVMAVINSFIAFFDTVRSVIQYIREILEIVDRYVSTIAAVAAGNVAPGAEMLESGLAAAIPVALGFLANILHLGDVPQKIREIIESLREMIDEALTWLFEQAMTLGGAALGALGLGGDDSRAAPAGAEEPLEEEFDIGSDHHRVYVNPAGVLILESSPTPIATIDDLRTEYANWNTLAQQPLPDVGPARSDLISQRRRVINRIVAAVKAHPEWIPHLAGDAAATAENPMASAPGIGNIAPYGQQQDTVMTKSPFPAVWSMQKEHVIPFNQAQTFRSALGFLSTAERRANSDFDDALYTITIYTGAARLKTPADNTNSRNFKSRVDGAAISGQIIFAQALYDERLPETVSQASAIAGPAVAALDDALETLRASAVTSTNSAVTAENTTVLPGATLTNGVRRAEGSGVPSPAAVSEAAREELLQIRRLAHADVDSMFDGQLDLD